MSGSTREDAFSFSGLIDTRIEEAYDIIENNYYHFSEKQVSDIQDGIIRGVVESLKDKHSEFLTTEEAIDFNDQLSGDLEGIGAVIDAYDKGVIVEQVLDDSPAKEAGLIPGDVIFSANGVSLRNMEPSEAVKYIKGPANTKVDLMVQKGGIGEEAIVTIIRRKIIIPSVRSEIFTGSTAEETIGYIDLTIFGENSPQEFEKKLGTILDANPAGLIIDLRQNGGGFLDVAVDVLSHFFPKDRVLVMTRENDPQNNTTLFSHGAVREVGSMLPIVILVDGYSASASEIVAGAFQDYKRAIIVGETTYGKGSVQQPFMLSDGSELKITVARWFTPYDRGIDLIGITPDIESRLLFEDYENAYDRQLETAKEVILTWAKNGSRDETIAEFTQTGSVVTDSGATLSGSLPE